MNDSVNSSPIPGYVSVKEAAEMLGISPRTVYDYIEEGRLPSARFADVIAISREASCAVGAPFRMKKDSMDYTMEERSQERKRPPR